MRRASAAIAMLLLAAAEGLAQPTATDRAELRHLREQSLQARKNCALALSGATADALRALHSLARRGVGFDLQQEGR